MIQEELIENFNHLNRDSSFIEGNIERLNNGFIKFTSIYKDKATDEINAINETKSSIRSYYSFGAFILIPWLFILLPFYCIHKTVLDWYATLVIIIFPTIACVLIGIGVYKKFKL